MPTDATGTPTSPDSIPKYNTSADAPSGLGFNAAMDAIQTLFTSLKNGTMASGKIAIAALAGYPADGTKVLKGDGTWAAPSAGAVTLIDDLVVSGSVLASYDTNVRLGGNIPQTYKHLQLIISARGDNAASSYVVWQANGDTAANYGQDEIAVRAGATPNYVGNNGQTYAYAGYILPSTETANYFASSDGIFYDYTSTAHFKNYYGRAISPGPSVQRWSGSVGGRWASTTAITRLVILPNGATNFAIGSRFSLYGIS